MYVIVCVHVLRPLSAVEKVMEERRETGREGSKWVDD